MDELNLKAEQKLDSVENFQFEPIKGYPMLRWQGKRPFRSTNYYPAQLKESFGTDTDGWFNKIFWGDNLQVMSHLLKQFRGQVDLVYIDPPFDSKADYKKTIEVRGKKLQNDISSFEEKQYTDIWTNDEYLQFMYERLIMLRELLSNNGSIYIHCDWHKVHLIRCILEEVFGAGHVRNEIVWHYQTYQGQVSQFFPRKHDTIIFATKSDNWTFHLLKDTEVEKTIDFTRWNSYLNENNEITGANYPATDSRFDGYYKRFVNENHRKPGPNDVILKLEGNTIDTVWTVKAVDPKNLSERLGYPTQKPEELLERIIKASTNPGDLVFDCFMGSGTTQAVAMKLGRRFLGADINLGAIDTTVKRLVKIQKNSQSNDGVISFGNQESEHIYSGFEVYNVNNYDVFRNPIEAKELLIKALELQPLPGNNLYDGEKDGRMVKIMPVNRIATRSDLNELITNFPYAIFDKRAEENPNKPVEYLTLVCMGHEPDLAGYLKIELKKAGYLIDVEVIDILRDKTDIEFKRDSTADIYKEGQKLVIRDFYPMNLLQKLSLQQEAIDDWRVLVDSIKIDFNYDGSVFSPTTIDIPGKKEEMVSGVYSIPDNATRICVKITDLLSETFETTIDI